MADGQTTSLRWKDYFSVSPCWKSNSHTQGRHLGRRRWTPWGRMRMNGSPFFGRKRARNGKTRKSINRKSVEFDFQKTETKRLVHLRRTLVEEGDNVNVDDEDGGEKVENNRADDQLDGTRVDQQLLHSQSNGDAHFLILLSVDASDACTQRPPNFRTF